MATRRTTKLARVPTGTGDLRRRLTAAFVADDPKDEVLFTEAMRTMALIDELERDVALNGTSLENSAGTRIGNPSVSQLARQRQALARLLAALFPTESPRTRAARAAANARWSKE